MQPVVALLFLFADPRHLPQMPRIIHLSNPLVRSQCSEELLRVIGALQERDAGIPLVDGTLDTLAAESGIVVREVWPFIEAGVCDGDIDVDQDNVIRLTAKGWEWWLDRY